MKQFLIVHGAHLVFVLIGVVAFFWMAYRPERDDDDGRRESRRQHLEEMVQAVKVVDLPAGHVRRSVAVRGLLALGPLLGAVATGAVLYAISIGSRPAPGAVIWAHAGISTLALLLVVYKVGALGRDRLRVAFMRQRLSELVSVALGVVSVPLALTGVVLLFAASSQSFIAYAHLVSSVWWTGMLAWHLRRYLGASLRAAMRPASADPGRLVAVEGGRDGLDRRAA